ncbi:ABC transporter permease [Methylovirgula sp. 4M-Z18]|uniref:ABC transporter permease n=1 Tax=Methylovirgula sp. 4M-Z18 TaxID=2293567 RepID=UPI000E2EFF63|nr:ABC transporter permease subunit [Methylovirgula sp. 4M-Z18]RFB75653.1 ABC transporter permease subunit [Methylovirgula sp. 4M-Z18]
MDMNFLVTTFQQILAVLPTTLALFALCVPIGAVLAMLILWMRMSANPILSGLAKTYIFFFRGTPLLIQMFLIFYGLAQFMFFHLPPMWWVLASRFWTAVMCLAFCTAAYSAEIFRGGLLAVPAKEIEAARAIGMSGFKLLRRIIAPNALRQALPAYSTEVVLMLKSTSLAGLIGVVEMTGVAQAVGRRTLHEVATLALTGIIYLTVGFLAILALGWVERLLSPHLRFMPPSAQTPRTIVG